MRISTRRLIALAALGFFLRLPALAQTGIGTAVPDASAALDIVSSNKGALLPRLTQAQRLAMGVGLVPPPATGLIVFQTDGTAGFYYNAGSPATPDWQQLATAAGAAVTATNGLTKTGSTVGLGGTLTGATTIANAGFNFNITGAGNVGIGTSSPKSRLSISSGAAEAKITLWDGGSTTNHYGFGISDNQLNYHVNGPSDRHVFFAGGKNGNGTELLRIQGNGNVGIGAPAPTATLHVGGAASTLRVEGLGNGSTRLLTVDGSGNLVAATALPAGTTGDNLGDHTATTNLNLGTHEIRGNGGTTGIGVAANGGLIIGQGTGTNLLIGQAAGALLNPAGGGTFNTFVGCASGQSSTTAERNTFVGMQTGPMNTTGKYHTFLGMNAGFANTIGSYSTLLGFQAGTNNTTGDGLTALGVNAGVSNTTGTGNTLIGYLADVTVNNLTNATAIGYGAQVSQSNSLVLGGTGAQTVNVGIGTTAPDSRLDVVQTARTGTHASGRALYVTGDFGEASNGAEFRHTNGTQGVGIGYNSIYATGSNADQHLNLMPRGTGKVGIGLTNPLYALDVLAPASLAGRLSSTQAGGTWWSLANSSAGAGGFHFIATGSGNGEGANKLLLTRGPAGSNTGYLITMDGNTLNVGIGTPTPTQALDVSGGLLVRANNAISTQGAYLHWNRSGSDGETWLLNQQGGGGANAGIRFGSVTTANVTTEWGRFLNNGNFGIGTTAPGTKLDVAGNMRVANASGEFYVNNFGGSAGMVLLGTFNGAGGNGPQLRFTGAAGFMDIGQNAAGDFVVEGSDVPRLTVLNAGNVGIGTPTPTQKLDVAGNARISSADATQLTIVSTAADPNGAVVIQVPDVPACASCSELMSFRKASAQLGAITMNAAGTGVDYVTLSDKRRKENIRPTHYGLADLLRIQVKDYNFIGTAASTRETGFLAQDLFGVYPDAVKVGDAGATVTNPWAVDYGKLTPLLVQAIQDQQREIEALRTANARLQQQATQAEADHASLLTLQAQMARLLLEDAGPAAPQARK